MLHTGDDALVCKCGAKAILIYEIEVTADGSLELGYYSGCIDCLTTHDFLCGEEGHGPFSLYLHGKINMSFCVACLQERIENIPIEDKTDYRVLLEGRIPKEIRAKLIAIVELMFPEIPDKDKLFFWPALHEIAYDMSLDAAMLELVKKRPEIAP